MNSVPIEALKSPYIMRLESYLRHQWPTDFADEAELKPVASFYTQPELKDIPEQIHLKQFWHGTIPLPKELPPHQEASIPAALVKKGGDYPAFWHKQGSFIAVMEEFYLRMRKNNQKQM